MSRRPSLSCLLALSASLLAACGATREGARDEATRETCAHYERCGDVGAGMDYATRDECEVEWRGTFNNVFTAESCTDKVNGEQFDACLTAIRTARCNDAVDFLNAMNRCSANSVCTGN